VTTRPLAAGTAIDPSSLTYKRPGTLRVTVTLSDGGGRRSIAHSTVVVRRR